MRSYFDDKGFKRRATHSSAAELSMNSSGLTLADNRLTTLQRKKNLETAVQAMPLQKKSASNGLPPALRSGIEQLSGLSMDQVKVHYHSAEPSRYQAHAFARGSDIHIASGQEKHLAHEAWHVVQQMQGRVTPTFRQNGAAINDNISLEQEADQMGARASQSRGTPTQLKTADSDNEIIQRIPLVGNFVTDAVSGAMMTAASNLSWLAGLKPHRVFLPVLTGAGFATGMYAVLKKPTPPGQEAHHAPANVAWTALSNKKTANNGAFYVRAHLLRAKFGGPAIWENLTPLTNAGNNFGGDPLSHFHSVETPISVALKAGRTVGYRVIPIYEGLPFLKMPTTIVNSIIGMVPGNWCKDLRNILYYENFVPTAFWTSWWYQDSWNPTPSIRVIRNWAPFSASFNYTINGRTLSFAEWAVLGISEILKFAISSGWAQSKLLDGLFALYNTFGISLPVPRLAVLDSLISWFNYFYSHYPRAAKVLGNFGSTDVTLEFRKHFPQAVGGLIPSIGEAIALGPAAASAAGAAYETGSSLVSGLMGTN